MKTVRYASAGGIVIAGDAVLLLHRPARGEVRLPKGHIEDGESAEVAALRETTEETGYVDLEIESDLGSQVVEFDYNGKHVVRTERYFLMRLGSEMIAPRPVKDEAQFQILWTSLDKAAQLLTFDAEKRMLEAAVRRYREG